MQPTGSFNPVGRIAPTAGIEKGGLLTPLVACVITFNAPRKGAAVAELGRRAGLRGQWVSQTRAGSNPARGTIHLRLPLLAFSAMSP